MRPVTSMCPVDPPPKTEGTPRHMQRGMLQSGAKTEGCRGEREQQEAWAKASRLKMRGTARLPTSPYLETSALQEQTAQVG